MGKSINIIGKKYYKLLVVGKSNERGRDGSIMWECVCDCGNTKLVSTNSLNVGAVKSCGCLNVKDNLIGKRFGRLVVVEDGGYSASGHTRLCRCICDCGNEKDINASSLKRGTTVSCGCYSSEQKSLRSKTHGIGNESRLYRIWSGMKSRCYSTKDRNYFRYGGRGIEVDDVWRYDFIAFQKWALENGYSDELSIDRKNNDGPYSPDNCRWATRLDQSNNRRTSVTITYHGETRTVAEWSKITGIKSATLAQRKRNGWDDKDCIETPVNSKSPKNG